MKSKEIVIINFAPKTILLACHRSAGSCATPIAEKILPYACTVGICLPVDSSYDSDSLVLGWNEDLTGDFYSQEQSKDNQFDTDDDQRWAVSMVSDREDDNRRS